MDPDRTTGAPVHRTRSPAETRRIRALVADELVMAATEGPVVEDVVCNVKPWKVVPVVPTDVPPVEVTEATVLSYAVYGLKATNPTPVVPAAHDPRLKVLYL